MLGHVPEKGGCESHCTLAEIAADVGVLAPSVSRVVKDLRGRNLVRTIRQGKHEINPWIAYNGDFDSWNSEAEDWPEPTWVRGADAETGEIK
jgi:DNA-binding transcriptional ArsR family regulator